MYVCMIVYVYYIFVGLVNGKTIQETPIFDGKIQWFPVDVPLNQSMDIHIYIHVLYIYVLYIIYRYT